MPRRMWRPDRSRSDPHGMGDTHHASIAPVQPGHPTLHHHPLRRGTHCRGRKDQNVFPHQLGCFWLLGQDHPNRLPGLGLLGENGPEVATHPARDFARGTGVVPVFPAFHRSFIPFPGRIPRSVRDPPRPSGRTARLRGQVVPDGKLGAQPALPHRSASLDHARSCWVQESRSSSDIADQIAQRAASARTLESSWRGSSCVCLRAIASRQGRGRAVSQVSGLIRIFAPLPPFQSSGGATVTHRMPIRRRPEESGGSLCGAPRSGATSQRGPG